MKLLGNNKIKGLIMLVAGLAGGMLFAGGEVVSKAPTHPNMADTKDYMIPPLRVINGKSTKAQHFTDYNPKEDLCTYYDHNDHFSIGIPESWTRQSEAKGDQILLKAESAKEHANDQFQENMVLVFQKNAKSLNQFYQGVVKQINELKDAKIDETGNLKYNGLNVKWIIYTHRKTSWRMKNLAYVFVKNNKGYVLNFCSPPLQFERYKPFFIRIAKTLKIN